MNNILGATGIAGDAIAGVQYLLQMDSETDKMEGKDSFDDSVHSAIANKVLTKKGCCGAMMIMNAWSCDQDIYLALLRRASPVGSIPERMNSI